MRESWRKGCVVQNIVVYVICSLFLDEKKEKMVFHMLILVYQSFATRPNGLRPEMKQITENGHGRKKFECFLQSLAIASSKVDTAFPPKILHMLSDILRMPMSVSNLVDFGFLISRDNFNCIYV